MLQLWGQLGADTERVGGFVLRRQDLKEAERAEAPPTHTRSLSPLLLLARSVLRQGSGQRSRDGEWRRFSPQRCFVVVVCCFFPPCTVLKSSEVVPQVHEKEYLAVPPSSEAQSVLEKERNLCIIFSFARLVVLRKSSELIGRHDLLWRLGPSYC